MVSGIGGYNNVQDIAVKSLKQQLKTQKDLVMDLLDMGTESFRQIESNFSVSPKGVGEKGSIVDFFA